MRRYLISKFLSCNVQGLEYKFSIQELLKLCPRTALHITNKNTDNSGIY